MRNKFRIIGVSLAAMAGLLLVSGVAWANPNKEPVSGQVVSFSITEPGEFWIDDDGVRHWRNRWARKAYNGDIQGVWFGVFGANLDPSIGGDGDVFGAFYFNGYVGEDEDLVSATGRFACVRSGPPIIWECDFVWHTDDGRLIKMTELQPGGLNPPWDYVGEILDPPGHR